MESAGIPLSRTKITVPARREGLLTRPRLMDELIGMLEKKLILVSAPAGYGKTSLLTDLASHTDLKVCWLSLDTLDRDPQRFASYFIAAIAAAFPAFGKESQNALARLTSQQGIESLVITLTNEVYELIHEHFIFVMDDFHLVEDVPLIQDLVGRFIQLADENYHLIIASRRTVKLPQLPVMIAREQVDGLDYVELAFRAEEIQSLLAHRYHISISTEQARELELATEGWVTSLQFVGADLLPALADKTRPARVAGVDKFDFLGQQVLDQQPADLQEFLLQTSFLEEFNAEFCEKILGPFTTERDWGLLMGEVLERNLFVLPVGENGSWLRYHHLFRDFLQQRLKVQAPEQANRIQERLAKVYEETKDWEKAFAIYRDLGDQEKLADMIEEAGSTLLVSASITLEGMLNALTPSVVQAHPYLLSLQGGILMNKGDVRQAVELFNQAEAALRSRNDAKQLNITLIRRSIAFRYLSNYPDSLRDAEEVFQFSRNQDGLQDIYAEALRLIGSLLHRMGQPRKAVLSFEESLEIFRRLKKQRNAAIVLIDVGMTYRALGDYTSAEKAYQQSLDFWRAEEDLNWRSNLLNSLGVLYHMKGQYEKALLSFHEGLACAERSHYARIEALIQVGLGDLFAEIEEYNAALQMYGEASKISHEIKDGFINNYLEIAQANLALQRGDIQTAGLLIDKTLVAVEPAETKVERGRWNLVRGRVALARKDGAAAVSAFRKAETCFEDEGLELETNWSRIWLAAALLENKQKDEAVAKLSQAISKKIQAPHSLYIHLRRAQKWLSPLQLHPEIGRLLSAALTKANELDSIFSQARRKLRIHTKAVEIPSSHIAIKALGKAEILVNDHPLPSSDWQKQSIRLFFYFFTLHTPVTKEQALDALWPGDEDPSTLKVRFKNFIYRLRRGVGQDVIVYQNDLYRFNPALDFEYDVEAFDANLIRSRAASDPHEKLVAIKKAVDLVRGPYLDDLDDPWLSAERERIRAAFLDALRTMAELYRQKGQFEEALHACQQMIRFDRFDETSYKLAMQISAARGDRANIARQYEACKQALAEIDISPSEETEALYRQLSAQLQKLG